MRAWKSAFRRPRGSEHSGLVRRRPLATADSASPSHGVERVVDRSRLRDGLEGPRALGLLREGDIPTVQRARLPQRRPEVGAVEPGSLAGARARHEQRRDHDRGLELAEVRQVVD